MARQRRLRRISPINPPTVSFRTIAVATLCFVSTIAAIIVLASIRPKSSSSSSSMSSKATTAVRFDNPQEIPENVIADLDAILVLGGGVPLSIDEPPIFTQRRCDDAAQVVKRHAALKPTTRGLPILCLSAGTAHLPQLLSPDGLPVWEATSSAAYLLKEYSDVIDKSQVYVETTSYDTISNAFFARTSFTDISGWRKLLIITNEFHMDRSQAIFDWIFGLDAKQNDNYQLYYLAPPNVGLTEAAVNARKEREAKSQKNVQDNLSKKYTSLKGVWTFLTQEHSLYTAHKLVERGRATTENSHENQALKESYGLSSNNNNEASSEASPEAKGTDSLRE